ncbi:hypothetical protein C0R09_08560 [Brevibacillus laterosporus]|uniref:hypothetical protein n=2 Tax=Brevibacillus laterosporus TaxID=1465 RepID=UPI000C78ADC2|nr:hypothetical protein [Brevibacillus laterosporus]AUM64570.1 hypothetical protein C0R09_08560 [Brevibacillus laterosporus]
MKVRISNKLKKKAPGTPVPDKWGGKVTNVEGLFKMKPDHIILLADNDKNVLEESSLWKGLQAVKNGRVYRMTSRKNYNEAFFALGKQALMEQVSKAILQKEKE